jgi:hypothetical protein
MKTYNRALDNMALAAAHYIQGNEIVAAAFFQKAVESADVQAALAIIEASNAQAFAASAAKPAATAAKKPVAAGAKKITAAERKQLAALVGADVVNAEFGEMEPEGEPEKVEDEAVHEEDEDVPSFAQALAALKKSKK